MTSSMLSTGPPCYSWDALEADLACKWTALP